MPLQQYPDGLAPDSSALAVPDTTWLDPGERSTEVLHVDLELLGGARIFFGSSLVIRDVDSFMLGSAPH